MAKSAELVDEIWTASRHSAEAIRRKVAKPVHVVPPAVDPPAPAPLPAGPAAAGGEGPLFLTCFDFDSVIERKNPEGAMAAFRLAFPAGGARLLVKSVNGHLHPERLAALAAAAADRPDIHVVDRYLERAEQAALIAACDVFVSLHRAEGFGLMLAEAMWFGRPVVATGYSGNLEFMDEETARLIPWRPAEISTGAGPYSGSWAEPDLEAAAGALRDLADPRGPAHGLGDRAARQVSAEHSVAARGRLLLAPLRALARATPGAEETQPARDWIEERIRHGPNPAQQGRFGRLTRSLRHLVLRATRLQTLHQREIDLALLRHFDASLAESEGRIAGAMRELRSLEGALRRRSRDGRTTAKED